jgi:elongation factor Ts
MPEITAAAVKQLREKTGAGMMECKKALVEAGGDIEKAIDLMRKSGIAKAAKKAGRIAAEGVIVLARDPQGPRTAMVEVNCETDFVTKADDFKEFAEAVGRSVLHHRPLDLAALAALPLSQGGETVEARRQALVARIGENIHVRRFALLESEAGTLGAYLHGNKKIGVLVDLERGDAELAKDMAMHIAASRPLCVSEDQVPLDLIAREKEIYAAQAAESGKPAAILDKMVAGKLQKYLAEVTLLGQPFIKDPATTVGELLTRSQAKVRVFVRFEVGEGLEKRVENFAQEVMAQVSRG